MPVATVATQSGPSGAPEPGVRSTPLDRFFKFREHGTTMRREDGG